MAELPSWMKDEDEEEQQALPDWMAGGDTPDALPDWMGGGALAQTQPGERQIPEGAIPAEEYEYPQATLGEGLSEDIVAGFKGAIRGGVEAGRAATDLLTSDNAVARAIRAAVPGADVAAAASAVPGVKEGLAEISGSDTLRPVAGIRQPESFVEEAGRTVVRTLPQLAAQLGITAINPGLGLGYAIASETGGAYEQARDAGATEDQALAAAFGTGALSGMLEKYGADVILKHLKGPRAGLANFIESAAGAGLTEAGTEASQGITARLAEKLTYDPEMPIGAEGIFDPRTMALEGIAGYAAGAGVTATGQGLQRRKVRQWETDRDAHQAETARVRQEVERLAALPEDPLEVEEFLQVGPQDFISPQDHARRLELQEAEAARRAELKRQKDWAQSEVALNERLREQHEQVVRDQLQTIEDRQMGVLDAEAGAQLEARMEVEAEQARIDLVHHREEQIKELDRRQQAQQQMFPVAFPGRGLGAEQIIESIEGATPQPTPFPYDRGANLPEESMRLQEAERVLTDADRARANRLSGLTPEGAPIVPGTAPSEMLDVDVRRVPYGTDVAGPLESPTVRTLDRERQTVESIERMTDEQLREIAPLPQTRQEAVSPAVQDNIRAGMQGLVPEGRLRRWLNKVAPQMRFRTHSLLAAPERGPMRGRWARAKEYLRLEGGFFDNASNEISFGPNEEHG